VILQPLLIFVIMKKSTAVIHHQIGQNGYGAIVEPLVASSTFLRGEDGVFLENRDIYSRSSNPNRRMLEQKLAILENGHSAVCFSSGQAATMAVFQSLSHGKHLILPDDIYFGTKVLIDNLYQQWGLTYTVVDMCSLDEIQAAIKPNTGLIWIESPSNPRLKVVDIEAVVDWAKLNNVLTVCDNTWASPFFTNPLDFGVDIVVHSSTKYLGGHSDLLGGVAIFKETLPQIVSQRIRDFQTIGGAIPSPYDCWLLSRSLATFHLRMPIHASNAARMALFFENHPKIQTVFYPGLTSNVYHSIAKKQMKNGFGGMLSLLIKGDEANCLRVASRLKVFKHATSLGGVESLVDHRKTAEGIHSVSPGNLLRISVGIEDIEDLIADFEQALA
jgi:cystathionine gamma-synthase